MVTTEQGRGILIRAAEQDTPHGNYKKWADEAKFWRGIVSGRDLDDLIVSYKLRESDEQKTQRLRLTKPPTRGPANRTLSHFNRLQSTDKKGANITYQREGTDKAILTDRLSNFSGGRSLENYLFETFTAQVATDPHSFLLVLFDGDRDSRGNFIDKPFPRPEIVPCEQVWDINHINDVPQWLLRKVEHSGEVQGVESGTPNAVPMGDAQAGQRLTWVEYTLYFAGYVQTLTQITRANPVGELKAGQELVEVRAKGKDTSTWLLSTYPTLQSRVPFIQYGYKRDPIDRETFVSVMEPARTDFENLVNRASEYALMLALHVFLQKYQYVGKCTFSAPGQGMCQGGQMSGTKQPCTKCGGTGNAILATVQDVVTIKLPDEGEAIVPLQNMIYYPALPFDIVNHLKAELDEKPDLIERAMWGVLLGEKQDVATTATEVARKYDSVYSVLSKAAQHWAEMYEHAAYLVAEYAEVSTDLTVDYYFPADYEMETLDELLLALKHAQESGAGSTIEDGLRSRILKKQFKDAPDVVAWEQAQQRHKPFRTKTESEQAMILSMLPEADPSRVLWTFFDEIFAEIRFETPDFPNMPYSGAGATTQKAVVAAKVAEYAGRIQAVEAEPTRDAFSREVTGGDSVAGGTARALDVQQLALARVRASEGGDSALAARLGAKINELLDKI